jgi:hypothetical protein
MVNSTCVPESSLLRTVNLPPASLARSLYIEGHTSACLLLRFIAPNKEALVCCRGKLDSLSKRGIGLTLTSALHGICLYLGDAAREQNLPEWRVGHCWRFGSY